MRILQRLFVVFILSGVSGSVYGQVFNFNPPTITGQRPTPLITEKNTPITIAFQNLRVSDPDIFVPAYPQGYTLEVFAGTNYAVANATVTPHTNFAGTLTVQVRVNDGKFNSNIFDLKIDVLNSTPVITGQEDLSVKEGSPIPVLLTHLKVVDNDNAYPDDFLLKIYDGVGYSAIGNTITPAPNFTGKLNVTVTVNDGNDESEKYDLTIQVNPNIVPVIKGQQNLETWERQSIELELGHLIVDDPDNSYFTGFTLTVFGGNNYDVVGNVVTPRGNFVGQLKVPVTVHDGLDESKKYEMKIEVLDRNNVIPKITGQKALITNEDQPITVTVNDLVIVDPDNNYPDDFSLHIPNGPGLHYTVSENKVTPELNYNGVITLSVRVDDNYDFSEPFSLSISVTPVNDVPIITGQDPVKIPADRTTALQVSSLKIIDPDDPNTSGFTLRILPGTNYIASESSITPLPDFQKGILTVRVVVNDGVVDSAPFNMKVEVVPLGPRPLITGQQPLVIDEDTSLQLKLSDLFVTDADDPYPTGFSMTVYPGKDYTYQGTVVTPKPNINGILTVNVSVNDGNQESEVFELKIFIIPVNDAPEITEIENVMILYEPGGDPVQLTSEFKAKDIDSEYLLFAEVIIGDSTFLPLHDELLFEDTEKIRGIYDASRGILSLIGSATLEEYDSAIRSIKYHYMLTMDEEGNYSEVKPGFKKVHFTLNDGQRSSAKALRMISIESAVDLDIPNSFTPNGDKAHDTWHVKPTLNARQFDKAVVRVYNKRGLLIYESKGFEKSWDGTFKGERLPVDTYYYTIDLMLSYTTKSYKGAVMIFY
jgi:gliding motility-associated-like protein